jgi:phage terminase large subunit GpA-like protein
MSINIAAVALDFSAPLPAAWGLDGWDYDACLTAGLWSAEEAAALAPPPDMTVSEWADARRILQAGVSREPGPWVTAKRPYLRDFMDSYCLRSVRNIVMCAGTQLGKTEALFNMLGYVIDCEPYPTMLMYPRDDDAKLISNTRIQPMINECETLQAKKSQRRSEFKVLEMHFPAMILYLTGANSLAGLASKPARNLFRDEGDKFSDRLGADADPDSKSEERTKDYWDIRKIVDVSSPTIEKRGIIAKLRACDVIRVLHHLCPHCQRPIRLSFRHIKYDDQKDSPHRIMVAKQSAYYACQLCAGTITNAHRPWLIANYCYVDQSDIGFGDSEEEQKRNVPLGELGFEPESLGFWMSSLSSPRLTWGDVVEIWLKAIIHRDQTGETTKMMTVVNDWFAEPWYESVIKSTVDLILAKRGLREPLVVPSWAVALTCGIDVQKYGFWFTVWAWSKGMQSALIHYGSLVTWDDVHKLVFDTLFDVEDSPHRMPIWRAAMDTGGGKDSTFGDDWTKTEEIVAWIRDNGQGIVFAVKGMSSNSSGLKIKMSILDKMPGEKGGVIPGGLAQYLIDTNQLKDNIAWRFENKEVDPQPLELHKDTGADFALQMTAEEKQQARNGTWSWVRVRRDNHYLDTTVYAHAAADFQWLGGVKILQDPQYAADFGTREQGRHRPVDPREAARGVQRPGWLTRRR